MRKEIKSSNVANHDEICIENSLFRDNENVIAELLNMLAIEYVHVCTFDPPEEILEYIGYFHRSNKERCKSVFRCSVSRYSK